MSHVLRVPSLSQKAFIGFQAVLLSGLLLAPAVYAKEDSKELSDKVDTQGQGSIDLFKNANAPQLEDYRSNNSGHLSFGFQINEAKAGSEKSTSMGVGVSDAVLTVVFSTGTTKTYSISKGDCYTKTYSIVAPKGLLVRQAIFTLLGSDHDRGNRADAGNAIQSSYDSTLRCKVPDALDKAVSANLSIKFPDTETSKGDPELFYDYSGDEEKVAILNDDDEKYLDEHKSGCQEAPVKADTPEEESETTGAAVATQPAPVVDPMAITSWNSFPANNTYYTVAYEDMYPKQGDYDFNDLVVAYQVQFGLNANNQVVKITGNAYLMAKGAAFSHDWHLRIGLPDGVKSAVTCSTALSSAPSNPFPCNGVNPIASTGTADVTVFTDTGKIFPSQFTDYRKVFTNTLFGAAYLKGPRSTFSITLSQPVDLANIAAAPFDPYLYVRDTKQTIQLLQVNPAVKDAHGYPYGLLMPSGWNWPYEKTDVRKTYAQFANFAATQGASSVNWYNLPAKYQFYPSPQPTVWAW